MANLAKHYLLTTIPEFQQRVQAAAVQAAVNISGEDTDQTHAKSVVRQAFAQRVLQGNADINAIAWAIAANSTVLSTFVSNADDQSAIPDADLEFVITSIWDDVAGSAGIAAP